MSTHGGKVISRTDRVDALSERDREDMFALFVRYYEGVAPERFRRDLSGKQFVIRLFDRAGALVGFSTIQLLRTEYEGRRMLAVFSGDTVVAHTVWGNKALQSAFTSFLLRTRLRHLRTGVYWFLISKGYKTYLLMRHNLTSYPNYAVTTPPDARAVLDHVARLKYPEQYDPRRGVIVFDESEGRVRSEFEDLKPADIEKNPDIRFFVERNPGFAKGDELCCLAEVRLGELLFAGLKYAVALPLARFAERRLPARVARVLARLADALRPRVPVPQRVRPYESREAG